MKADAEDGVYGRLRATESVKRKRGDSEPWFDDNPCSVDDLVDVAVRVLSNIYSEDLLMQHCESASIACPCGCGGWYVP